MTGRLKIVGMLGCLTLAVFSLGLGGCSEQQKLKEENAALIKESEQLKTEKQQLASDYANAKAQLDMARAQQPQQPPANPPGGNDIVNRDPPRQPVKDRNFGGTRIEVAGDKLFASGSVAIMAAGKAELDKVAARIKKEFPGASIRVEGYTDSDPPKKVAKVYPTNEALSMARAQAVEKYLSSKGISSNRIEAVGMGSANPKSTKAASRRVEIVING